MQLAADTLAVLKNFAGINQNLLIKAGSVLETKDPSGVVYARANVSDKFPNDVGIANLSEFISVISIFKTPVIDFQEKFMTVSEEGGKSKIKYVYAAPEALSSPKKTPNPENVEGAEFALTQKTISDVLKAARVMNLPDLSLKCDGETISIVARDKSREDSNEYVVDVVTGLTSEIKYTLNIKRDNLSAIDGVDFIARVAKVKVAKKAEGSVQVVAVLTLTSESGDNFYLYALETDSSISGL